MYCIFCSGSFISQHNTLMTTAPNIQIIMTTCYRKNDMINYLIVINIHTFFKLNTWALQDATYALLIFLNWFHQQVLQCFTFYYNDNMLQWSLYFTIPYFKTILVIRPLNFIPNCWFCALSNFCYNTTCHIDYRTTRNVQKCGLKIEGPICTC